MVSGHILPQTQDSVNPVNSPTHYSPTHYPDRRITLTESPAFCAVTGLSARSANDVITASWKRLTSSLFSEESE